MTILGFLSHSYHFVGLQSVPATQKPTFLANSSLQPSPSRSIFPKNRFSLQVQNTTLWKELKRQAPAVRT
jgi:hypothetical protein